MKTYELTFYWATVYIREDAATVSRVIVDVAITMRLSCV